MNISLNAQYFLHFVSASGRDQLPSSTEGKENSPASFHSLKLASHGYKESVCFQFIFKESSNDNMELIRTILQMLFSRFHNSKFKKRKSETWISPFDQLNFN